MRIKKLYLKFKNIILNSEFKYNSYKNHYKKNIHISQSETLNIDNTKIKKF